MRQLLATLVLWTAGFAMLGTGVGCNDRLPVTGGNGVDGLRGIIPLKVGNSWTYHSRNATYWSDYVQTIDSVSIIEGAITFSGSENDIPSNGNGTFKSLLLRNRDGSTSFLDNSPPYDAYRTFKHPAQAGERYDYDTAYAQTDSLSPIIIYTEIVSTDTTITVPAGTFQCYHYRRARSSSTTPYWEIWIAPEVGIVRESGGGSPSLTFVSELTEYHLE